MTHFIKFTSRIAIAIILLMTVMGNNKAYATHYSAGDIYIQYIGTDSLHPLYRIYLKVYKVCEPNASSLGTTEYVTISSASTGLSLPSKPLPMISNDTIDRLCPVYHPQNSCFNTASIYPGFNRRIYSDTFTCWNRVPDLLFTWETGSRNGNITNLLNPGGQNIHIEAMINNLFKYNASTPVYLREPDPYLCVNQNDKYVNFPADTNNHDSLVTVNFNPQGFGGASLAYVTPTYSFANPVNGFPTAGTPAWNTNNGYSVNPKTGTAYFSPPNSGKYVLGFRTYFYDKATGTALGYTSRDVQAIVVPCLNLPPALTSTLVLTGAGVLIDSTTIQSCAGATMSFDIVAGSTSALSSMIVKTQGAPVNSTISLTGIGTSATTLHFSWTPSLSEVGTYVFSIKATDTTCNPLQPILLEDEAIITIHVLPSLVVSPSIKNACIEPFNKKILYLKADCGDSTHTFKWYNINDGSSSGLDSANVQNTTGHIYQNTTGYGVIIDPLFPFGCKSKDTVFITPDTTHIDIVSPIMNYNATYGDSVYIQCRSGYLPLTAAVHGLNPVSNIACGTNNPIFCATSEENTIGTLVSPTALGSPFSGQYGTSKTQFIISKKDILAQGMKSGSINAISLYVAQGGGAIAYNNFSISIGCTSKPRYTTPTDFENGLVQVYNSASFTPSVVSWNKFTFNAPYNWDTSMNLAIQICYSNGVSPVGGLNDLVWTTSQTYSCMLKSSQSLGDVCNLSSATVNVMYNFEPTVKFSYCPAPDAPFVYYWTSDKNGRPFNGSLLSDSTANNPIAYIDSSVKYKIWSTSRYGCIMNDSINIIVPIHHFWISSDTAYCSGQSVYRYVSGGVTYNWLEGPNYATPTTLSCNTCTDPIATPTVTTTYHCLVGDENNCVDTLHTTVTAYPLPPVHILNNDTTINFGQSLQLYSTGAVNYSWSPSGSLNDAHSATPIASPTTNTTYVLSGMDRNLCGLNDTINVTINTSSNLLIPSGFSPNGDGKNDEFKIIHLTFQKVSEFRVFNRWGQEIYSDLDGKHAWDGAWKGVAQDMGSYHYIIKLTLPTGIIETYKGDVTLLR